MSAPSQLLHSPLAAGWLACVFPLLLLLSCFYFQPHFLRFSLLPLCVPIFPSNPLSQFVFHSSVSLPSSLTLSLLCSLAWQGLLIGNKLWEGFQFEVKIASDLPPAVSFLLSFGCITGLYTVAECRYLKDRVWWRGKQKADSTHWLETAGTWQVNKQIGDTL